MNIKDEYVAVITLTWAETRQCGDLIRRYAIPTDPRYFQTAVFTDQRLVMLLNHERVMPPSLVEKCHRGFMEISRLKFIMRYH